MLLYIGSVIIILWGVAHIIPTKNIVKGFGEITADNKKILTMEVISEGLALIFIGVLPMLITILAGPDQTASAIVYLACAVMLIIMAVVTALTGSRTTTIWYKVCPAVKTIVAVLYILGALF